MAIVIRHLDTRAVAAQARHAAYLAAITHSLETEFLDGAPEADLIGFHLGDAHVIRLDASPRRSTRTKGLIERDRHDGVSFQYAVTGTSAGLAGHRPVTSIPGSVMILDFAQPFTMCDLGRRLVINLSVPRRLIQAAIGDPFALHGRVLEAPAINLFRDMLLSVIEDRLLISESEGTRIGRMMIDAVAVMLDRTEMNGSPGADALLDHAHAVIDARIGSQDLTPEWLGERLRLSRSELYLLFRASGGVSKAIWHRRLDAARAALSDSEDQRRIGEIAYAVGFSSEAHFARAFKSRFGMTARDLRMLHRGTQASG